MSAHKIYPVRDNISNTALINKDSYLEMYEASISEPDKFWAEQAEKFLTWDASWSEICSENFLTGDAKWFLDGKLNVSTNCIDRHLTDNREKIAIIWEGDSPEDSKHISYEELYSEVCKLGNLLRARGVKKGDRVCIYMPMVPEAAYAMLACTRIGAIHSVVFGGFSPEALKDRILDSNCKVVISANEGIRGGKSIPLKRNVDLALTDCPSVHTCLFVKRTSKNVDWLEGRDIWYEQVNNYDASCEPEIMDSEDPLFILYTSGSTGKPKGVMHTTGGYLLMAAMTHKYTFDYKDGDIYWCTADVGWVTGHSYIVYGPLCNGGTTLMFEGVPTYPDASRFWQVIDKHRVNQFYTAPTAIRALMGLGNDFVEKTSRKSLRILGTVGEPINPEAWEWYYSVVGETNCPIVDTWWQTETGAHMLTPLPGATPLKPGSATLPFFGIQPALLDKDGREIEGPGEGLLMIKRSWPSQLRSVYGDHKRFYETYFKPFPGYYFTGDGAKRDKDGYFWITGRVDDVLNVSGHRMGTAEIESALVLHKLVAEAAVVGFPHPIKGQGIYCYVTLMEGTSPCDGIHSDLIDLCKKEIGPIAKPDIIQWAPGLPKTRSGKIMRRILRKIAANDVAELGDTSTLADPNVILDLIENRYRET
ncbi:MAG: acetate--CoA ligase [Pseudomonadota bacterium]|nr:acetate--CoA ligase [Pseudomonadota bacterium]MEC8498591.1 acetate--CoA ligase [Pseudomonadota bacterium]